MLNVLIVEADPIIALDLSEAVRARDRRARVAVVADPRDCAAPDLWQGISHAFVRVPSEALDRGLRLVQSLCARGVRVVLLGVEALPEPLAANPCVSLLPFPFTSGDIMAQLEGAPKGGDPA